MFCVHFPIHILKRKYINFRSQGRLARAMVGVEQESLNCFLSADFKKKKKKEKNKARAEKQ